jgi:hypothetical protein
MADEITAANLSNLKINPVAVLATASAPTTVPPPAAAGAVKVTVAAALQPLSAASIKLLPVGPSNQAVPANAVAGVAAQAAAATTTTWQNGKNITNQWTINQDRNSWIGVTGIGWQKLSTASDSGCVALTMLGSSAIITKASVNYRTESDGMVHEIYVW